MKRYLVINIGNSRTNFAIFQNAKIIRNISVENKKIKTNLDFHFKIDDVFLGSVNPAITKIICKSLQKKYFITPIIITHAVNELKIHYKPVTSLGIDRLADVIAAVNEYPVPLVVVDCGTATTFNVVNSKKEFIGGAIANGITVARDALHDQTALLPRVALNNISKKKVIEQTTIKSLQSGLLHGFGSMIDALIDRIQEELKAKKVSIIATGGNAKLLKPYSKRIQKIDPYLTLKGIYLLGISQTKEK